jgi:CheY-like chemotaxis protein
MDLELPDMDGFAATEVIRGHRPAVPVIALTAHDDDETRARCRDAGMAAHLVKPVRAERLAEVIAGALGHTMDWSGALRALGGKEALLRRVADAFREEAPNLLATARAALEARDADELRRAAHTLHGSMRWFDAPEAQESARALEKAALAPDWDEARRLLPALDAAVARILPAVARFLRGL